MIRLFLPVFLFQLIAWPIGTFHNYKSLQYDYVVGVTTAVIIGNTVTTTIEVQNLRDGTLYVGEFNFDAYDSDTGKYIEKFSCLAGFQVILEKNQTGKGNICWKLENPIENVTIVYSHSAFITNNFAWKVL